MTRGIAVAAAMAAALFGARVEAASEASSAAATGAWRVACAAEASQCRIETAITAADGRIAARLAIGATDAQGKRYGEMVLPLGIAIGPGVLARVDEGDSFTPVLIACAPKGCHAAFEVSDVLLSALRAGAALEARVVDARSGRTMALAFSLVGFTAADKQLAAR